MTTTSTTTRATIASVKAMRCPACGSGEQNPTSHPGIVSCHECDAVYGECLRQWAVSQRYWTGAWSKHDSFAGTRYVDLIFRGQDGNRRVHGWVDDKGNIVQLG